MEAQTKMAVIHGRCRRYGMVVAVILLSVLAVHYMWKQGQKDQEEGVMPFKGRSYHITLRRVQKLVA